jgi:hypothetical protein
MSGATETDTHILELAGRAVSCAVCSERDLLLARCVRRASQKSPPEPEEKASETNTNLFTWKSTGGVGEGRKL